MTKLAGGIKARTAVLTVSLEKYIDFFLLLRVDPSLDELDKFMGLGMIWVNLQNLLGGI